MKNKNKIISIIVIAVFAILHSCFDNSSKYKVKQATIAPLIDGNIDKIWQSAVVDTIYKSIIGAEKRKDNNDFSIRFRSLWDKSGIYFLFEIKDDIKLNIPEMAWYQDDLIQLFFSRCLKKTNRDNTQPGDLLQYSFVYGNDTMLINGNVNSQTKIEFKRKDCYDGYVLEIKIPWNELKVAPEKGLKIPFNYEAVDLDEKISEEGILGVPKTFIGWAPNTANRSWTQTKFYGDLELY